MLLSHLWVGRIYIIDMLDKRNDSCPSQIEYATNNGIQFQSFRESQVRKRGRQPS